MFEMSSDQIIDFCEFLKENYPHKSYFVYAKLLCSSHAKILIKRLATKWHSWHFVLWLEVLARATRFHATWTFIQVKIGEWDMIICTRVFNVLQDRVGHTSSGFPGGPRTPVSDFQPPYFPPPFGGQQPTAQEVFAAAQAPHLAAAAAATADPYTNSALHNFQTSQVWLLLTFYFYPLVQAFMHVVNPNMSLAFKLMFKILDHKLIWHFGPILIWHFYQYQFDTFCNFFDFLKFILGI